MALIEIHRRCNECESTRTLLRETKADLQQIRLDYNSLYEKVRTNLAKLAKRAALPDTPPEEEQTLDPLAKARQELASRKLRKAHVIR